MAGRDDFKGRYDNIGEQNSINDNIEVHINSQLTFIGAIEALSHELYGHALLYIRNGFDHNGASHIIVGLRDTNTTLVKLILDARKETINNYNNRR